jgi:type II secretory ATPase GspE/PulE/Tfp pilus assembly ATPase PilB-like protein
MGVEPFLIASSVVGVLAQRLVRVICPKCKEAAPCPPAVAAEWGFTEGTKLFRGKGCAACQQSGYKGRVGIYELLPMHEKIKGLVVTKAPAHTLREAGRQVGLRSLRDDGIAKALAGVTTIEEVLRVSQLE